MADQYGGGIAGLLLRQADRQLQSRADRERQSVDRAMRVVVGEQARLAGPMAAAGVGQQSADQVVYGHAPGYGPEFEADQVERALGRYEQMPGWWNAKQFADATAQRAREKADSVLADISARGRPYNRPLHAEIYEDEFRKNRHLLSDPQLAYMQDVGRYVDLLRNLRSKSGEAPSPGQYMMAGGGPAEVALKYWDKSDLSKNPNAARAREDFNDPNYQRFAGNGMQSFFANPDSPLVQYFATGQLAPNAMKFAWEDPQTGQNDEAVQRAANVRASSLGRMLNGENTVLRQPQPADELDSTAWTQALGEAGRSHLNLQPAPWQNIANSGWRALQSAAQRAAGIEQPVVADATAAAGDLLGLLGDSVDPSLGASFVAGLPARASLLKHLAASQGRQPASIYRRVAQSIPGQAYQEGVPEVALGGSLNMLAGDPDRTIADYLTKPAADRPLDSAARNEAHRREEIRNLQQPQSIPEERKKAYHRYMPGGR